MRKRNCSFEKVKLKDDQTEEEWMETVKDYLPDKEKEDRFQFMSEDGMFLYHMAIIDYLQDFNLSKYGENKFKSIYKDGDLISAVPPDQYSLRFINFMQKWVLTNQK